MKKDRFSLAKFNQQFPDDAACLDYIWAQRFPQGLRCPQCHRHDGYTRVTTRKCYSCECGHQVSPCEGTIFHKSSTKLTTWFLAMFYMTASKNGVSAKELERLTGVTYKTAWRMGHQIRQLMTQGNDLLTGTVEADETYLGGARRMSCKMENKASVVAVVQRGGSVRAKTLPLVDSYKLGDHLTANVSPDAILMTDEARHYQRIGRGFASHETIRHSAKEYVRAQVHTNSVEGFWGQLKRSVNGTFHQVSREHLQGYVDEFAFRYNHRASVTEAPIFPVLVSRVGERRAQVA
jgi:transposase-like protein